MFSGVKNMSDGKLMREKINLREYGVVIGFLALCVRITIATPAFASHKNILNLLRQSSIIEMCIRDSP